MTKYKNSIVWLRHDLRLEDHAALKKACIESTSISYLFSIMISLNYKRRQTRQLYLEQLSCMKQNLRQKDF